ncbi:hypothetical protein JCM10207_007033 [Rhodosporidiobolus poonsookiae]
MSLTALMDPFHRETSRPDFSDGNDDDDGHSSTDDRFHHSGSHINHHLLAILLPTVTFLVTLLLLLFICWRVRVLKQRVDGHKPHAHAALHDRTSEREWVDREWALRRGGGGIGGGGGGTDDAWRYPPLPPPPTYFYKPHDDPLGHKCHGHSSEQETALEVADPLWLYYSLVAQGRCHRDPAQLAALVQLRKLHEQLLDYQPPIHLVTLLESLRSSQSSPTSSAAAGALSAPSSSLPAWPFRRSPLSVLGSGLSPEEEDERRHLAGLSEKERSTQVVRILKDNEGLENLATPKGFLLTGPPGTGKSFLMDLFFQSLPVPHKVRYHYHAFLLSIYQSVHRALEKQRLENEKEERLMNELYQKGDGTGYPWSRREEMKARAISKGWQSVFAGGRSATDAALNTREFVLAQVALDLIKTQGWLLAFDEVQLVDIAGAGLVSRVMSWYWRLGGVVVGTSNRVPDDLYKQGIQRQTLSPFLSALSHRSPVINLSSPTDYRLIARSSHALTPETDAAAPGEFGTVGAWTRWGTRAQGWFVRGRGEDDERWEEALRWIVGGQEGEPRTLKVYGRDVRVPWATGGVARFSFKDLCEKPLGPADYISLGSEFHTIILDDVPVLPLNAKNEARRLITLLDALYETKTRLLASAAAPIDALFFPDAVSSTPPPAPSSAPDFFDHASPSTPSSSHAGSQPPNSSGPIHTLDAALFSLPPASALEQRPATAYEAHDAAGDISDALVEEMLGDVQQDLAAPYRPNVSSYDQTDLEAYDEASQRDREERRAQKKREVRKELERQAREPIHPSAATPSFQSLAIFTGEEERFAFKRAVSRVHEMSSAEYLVRAVHSPLAAALRTWETPSLSSSAAAAAASAAAQVPARHAMGAKAPLGADNDKLSGVLDPRELRAKWPSGRPRKAAEKEVDVRSPPAPPEMGDERPRIGESHVWGVVENWGKRAGRWGLGARAYDEGGEREK